MTVAFNEYVIILGWIFALVITLSIALPILTWVANKILGDVDLLKEIRKKNLAAGILLAAMVLGASLVIGLAL
ncbi:MAG TPA: DUF350 domain-containing protein [Candidatus Uhrbacteria bacterium]|nr:DUF350 domain-containing protein [Candidatus Uhrbacteria bacterium]